MPVPRLSRMRLAPRSVARAAPPRLAGLALLPLLAACGLVEPATGRVSVRYQERAPLGRERLVVNLTDGRDEWYVEGTDLQPAGDGWLAGRTIRLHEGGPLRLSATLRGDGRQVAAVGDVTLPLDHGRHWRVDIFASPRSEAEACGGCDGVRRFVIAPSSRPSAQDWLYITWTDQATD